MGQDFKGYSCLLVDLSVNVIGSRITREVNKGTALGATEGLIRSWGSYQSMLGFLVEVVRWWHYWEVVKRKAWYLARRSNHWDFMPMGAVSCPAISLYFLRFLSARSWKVYSTMIPLPWCPTHLYGANNQAGPISGSSQQYSIVPGILWLGSCLMPTSHSFPGHFSPSHPAGREIVVSVHLFTLFAQALALSHHSGFIYCGFKSNSCPQPPRYTILLDPRDAVQPQSPA